MNNSQVAHIWAQQRKASGRGSNFYFDGPTLYSYGSHFVVARFVANDGGQRAVLFNSRNYSRSTSRHQSYARRAIPSGAPVFTVPETATGSYSHDINLAHYAGIVRLNVSAAQRRRREHLAQWDMECAARAYAEAQAYAEFFGLPAPEIPDPCSADALAQFAAMDERRAAEREKARIAAAERAAAEKAERAAEFAAALADWRECRRSAVPYYMDFPIALRVNGDCVQTTWGAEVPIDDARRALRYIAHVVAELAASGASYRVVVPDVCPIGHFTLDRINANGSIVAGCHSIAADELAALSAIIGG